MCLQGMSDLCVNPKGTVYYYIRDQRVLQNTGKYILCLTSWVFFVVFEDIRIAINDIV